MKHFLRSLICICTLLQAFDIAGQNYQFAHINKEHDGLVYNGIREMIQDSRGFMWIGTHKGLSRYDGTRFKNYDRSDFGTSSDFITSLAEDASGNIWIGTDNGIVIYRYALDMFETFSPSGAPDDRIFDIKLDYDSHVWIGSRTTGLFRYNPDSGELRRYPQSVNRIATTQGTTVWVASYCDNIYSVDKDSGKVSVLKTVPDPNYFSGDDVEGLAILPKTEHILYVASKRHGLCEVDTRSGMTRELFRLQEGHRPIELSSSSNRLLWMSTTEGLVRYDSSSGGTTVLKNDIRDRFSLSDNYVTCSVADKNSGLWVGTFRGGVNYASDYQNNFYKIYRTDTGKLLEKCMVKGFAEDSEGRVWVATEQEGLLLYDKSTHALNPYDKSTKLPLNITALCHDNGILWIGAQNGVYCLELKSGRVRSYGHLYNPEGETDNRVVSIFRSRSGDVFVCTTVGVLRYDRRQDSFNIIQELGSLTIEDIKEDGAEQFWLASYSSGVIEYDQHSGKVLNQLCSKSGDSMVPEMTSSLCIDEEGNVWMASFSSGLMRWSRANGDFIPVVITVPNTPEVMFSVIADDLGGLWITTNNGLIEYNPGKRFSRLFTSADGLLDNEFIKSGLKLSDGSIVFGSENGFIHFNPGSFASPTPPAPVRITDFKISGVSVSPTNGSRENTDRTKQISLLPKQRSFSFDFATPEASLSDNRIMCIMEGYDTDWTDITTTKSISYYNISPGTYTFRIETLSPDGTRSISHQPITIEAKPRFIESSWGIAIVILVIIAASLLIYLTFYRRAMAAEKQRQKDYERERDEQLYNEKMNFFSNVVHEIKTPLTLIKSPLRKLISSGDLEGENLEDLKLIDNSSEYMDQLVKELLEFVRVERHGYSLDIKRINIVQKLDFLCCNFQDTAKTKNIRLEYRHDEDAIFADADESALNKIFNNLIGNAVKYAESYVDVHAYKEGGFVSVSIRNDGAPIPSERREEIFKPFVSFSGDTQPYSQSFGIGLSLAQNLVKMHDGTLSLEPDPTCTKFVMRLPALAGVSDNEDSSHYNLDEYVNSSENPIIVIAEDNAELSGYLKRKLESSFRILAVPEAEQALPLLYKYDVSLLITDIAMRAMSGVELCGKVTSDIKISHIPVIVLSAISDMDVKIKCMENGASLYLEKPFDLDYLESCINSLLEKQSRIKSAYNSTGIIDINKMDLPDMDGKFFRDLGNIINDNLSDPDFSAKQMEEMLFMSHSTLNRKFKALLGTTPNEYLRTQRLIVAEKMLRDGNARVNEICYSVGFKSPSYFAKCFKARYGVNPIEYK